MQFTSGIANWLINKRRNASTSSEHPIMPSANSLQHLAANEEAPALVDLRFNNYVAQQHINMCGDAIVSMLYAYHGDNANIDMTQNPRGALEGQNFQTLRQINHMFAWRPNWRQNSTPRNYANLTEERLAYGLIMHGPLAASGTFARFLGQRWGHWVLVTGIVGNTVYMADPWHGEDRQKSFAWFKEHLNMDDQVAMLYYH